MLFACYDVFKRCLLVSGAIWGPLGGPGGVFVVVLGAPWGAWGSSWGVWGVLGKALGGPWASLGAPRDAKGVFGRHFGSPQGVLGSPESGKVYSRACGDRFCLHFVAFLCVMVACFAGWAWAERGLGADKVQ